MSIYTEKQFSWMITGILVLTLILVTLSYIYEWGQKPINSSGFIIVLCMIGLPFLLFFRMTTTISASHLTISYGIGAIKKTIPLNSIQSVSCVKGKWVDGAGIRDIKGGTLYSINFTDAVEIKLSDKVQFIRIGTGSPQKLQSAILQNLPVSRR